MSVLSVSAPVITLVDSRTSSGKSNYVSPAATINSLAVTRGTILLILHFPIVMKMTGLGYPLPSELKQPYGDNSGARPCPSVINISLLYSLKCLGFDGKLDYSEYKSEEILATSGNLSEKASMRKTYLGHKNRRNGGTVSEQKRTRG